MSFRKDYSLTASGCCLLATLIASCVPFRLAGAAAPDTVAPHAEVSLLSGLTEMRGAGQDSFGWSLDYRRPLGGAVGIGLTYLNEGHHTDHHRDGYAAQVLLRAPLDGRVSLWLGAGPYAYFDTSTGGLPWHGNDHGLGILYSAGASVALSGRWSFQARLHRRGGPLAAVQGALQPQRR